MNGFAVRRRVTGATLALLLQALFIALLVVSMRPVATPVKLIRELTLVLPRLKTEPPPPPPATASAPSRAPAYPLPVAPQILPLPEAAAPATPSADDLRGVGQALFGCAPQTWSSLTPEQRSHCTRPGDGVAIQQAPNLMGSPDHVKDRDTWQEQWGEDHWMPGPCPPSADAAFCLMEQAIAENKRAYKAHLRIADQKAKVLQEPKPPLPKTIGVHPQ